MVAKNEATSRDAKKCISWIIVSAVSIAFTHLRYIEKNGFLCKKI